MVWFQLTLKVARIPVRNTAHTNSGSRSNRIPFHRMFITRKGVKRPLLNIFRRSLEETIIPQDWKEQMLQRFSKRSKMGSSDL